MSCTVNKVSNHLLRSPLAFVEKHHFGDISRMGSAQTIQQTPTATFVESFIDGLRAPKRPLAAPAASGAHSRFGAHEEIGLCMKAIPWAGRFKGSLRQLKNVPAQ